MAYRTIVVVFHVDDCPVRTLGLSGSLAFVVFLPWNLGLKLLVLVNALHAGRREGIGSVSGHMVAA